LVPQPGGAGRPRKFCSQSHRQRAYEARRRADALMIPPGQTVVSEDDLRTLHDRLYRLEAAVQEALDHLLEASRDLVGLVVEPVRP